MNHNEEEIQSDLHIATALNHITILKKLLSQEARQQHLPLQDEYGDEPAHIAARLGHLECMKLLIEYDASHMKRRNWAGLTPLGEARMNGHKDIVDLILNNYAFGANDHSADASDTGTQPVAAWDDCIHQEMEKWIETWDTDKQCIVWIKKNSNDDNDEQAEISYRPPTINYNQIIAARNNNHPNTYIPRKVHPKSLPSQTKIRKEQRIVQLQQETIQKIKAEQNRLEYECAVKLQGLWRKKQAERIRRQVEMEHECACRIQVTWRWRYRDYRHRISQRAARQIQRQYRMRYAHHYYINFLQERLWWHRAANTLACINQRLWRGFKGRAKGRHVREKHYLPNPEHIDNFDFWIKCQEESRPPRRKFGIYTEYTLSGTPKTWQDRNEIKRHGLYYRDVKFYVNTVTRRASWDQRREWRVSDRREYEQREQARRLGYPLSALHAAQFMQSLWRAKISRSNMRMVLKAKRIMENAEETYLENPTNIKAVCNYALYVHVILHEYDKARPLYQFMLDFMEERGIDNPFVLYSCAIFSAVRREEDWHIIKDMSYRAKLAEALPSASNQMAKADGKKSIYEVANAGIYRLTALADQSGESWHNYALCRMLVFHDLAGAREAFLCALEKDPHNQHIVSNLNILIQDKYYMAIPAPWDVFDEIQLEERKKNKRSTGSSNNRCDD